MNLLRGLKMLIVVAMAVALGSGGVFAMDAGGPPADGQELSRLEQAVERLESDSGSEETGRWSIGRPLR